MTKNLETIKDCLDLISKASITEAKSSIIDAFVCKLPDAIIEVTSRENSPTNVKRLLSAFAEQVCVFIETHHPSDEQISILIRTLTQTNFSPFFTDLPETRTRLAKALVKMWASHPADSIRITVLLSIHSLCKAFSRGKLLETCMRLMWINYGRACRALTHHNLGQAALLATGLVEVFLINPKKGADIALTKLRNMASTLQLAMKRPSNNDSESTKRIFCWEFIARLRVFAHLMKSACELNPKERLSKGPVTSLLFAPVTGFLNALSSFNSNSPRHFPYHLHVVAIAIELETLFVESPTKNVSSSKTMIAEIDKDEIDMTPLETFRTSSSIGNPTINSVGAKNKKLNTTVLIPVVGTLLRIITHLSSQPFEKLETIKVAYDLGSIIKVSKGESVTRGFLECVADDTMYHLLTHLVVHSDHIAFPELVLPVIQHLRRLTTNNPRIDTALKKQIEGHTTKISQACRRIIEVRAHMTPVAHGNNQKLFSDRISASQSPLVSYVVSLERVRTQKRRLLAQRDLDDEDALKQDVRSQSNKISVLKSSSKLASSEKIRKTPIDSNCHVASIHKQSHPKKRSNQDASLAPKKAKKSKERSILDGLPIIE